MSTTPRLDAPEHRLRERAAELRREIAAKTGTRADEGRRDVGDQKDEADEQIQHTVDDAESERDRAELDAVEQALQRLTEGRYGRCVDCDAEIPAARLAAQPAALRCIACQAVAERR